MCGRGSPVMPVPAVRADHSTRAQMVLPAQQAAKSCLSAVLHREEQTNGYFCKVRCTGSCEHISALRLQL